MCVHFSCIAQKNKVIWLIDSSDHSSILYAAKISDKNKKPTFVRIESPVTELFVTGSQFHEKAMRAYDKHFKSGTFRIDQDLMPDWAKNGLITNSRFRARIKKFIKTLTRFRKEGNVVSLLDKTRGRTYRIETKPDGTKDLKVTDRAKGQVTFFTQKKGNYGWKHVSVKDIKKAARLQSARG